MEMFNIKKIQKSSLYQFVNLWNQGKDFLTSMLLCFLKVQDLKKLELIEKKIIIFWKKQILKFIKINGWYENR